MTSNQQSSPDEPRRSSLGQNSPGKSPRRFRFGMAVLFVITACFAVAFGGFRLGYDRGHSAGQKQWRSEAPYPVVYEVGDLVEVNSKGKPEIGSLIDHLLFNVEAESWDALGGPGAIVSVTFWQLVIYQTPRAHEEIRGIFQAIRDGRRNKFGHNQSKEGHD
jgi:hypothetical protein